MFSRRLRVLRPAVLSAFVLLLTVTAAQAGPDFFGIKMKSEDFAQDIFLLEEAKIPDFTSRPGTDRRIYAYGYMSSRLGGGRGISVQVFNHSEDPIATEKLFRELTIVTWDGRRYDRAETDMMWARDRLKAGEDATFNFSFPGIDIDKEEVRLVLCSFDLGETLIVMLPMKPPAQAETVDKKPGKLFDLMKWRDNKTLTEPPQKQKVLKKVKKLVKKEPPAGKSEEKKTVLEHCVTPVKLVQSFFRGVGERIGGNQPAAPPTDPSKPYDKDLYEEVEVEEWVEETVESPASAQPTAVQEGGTDKKRTPDYPLVKPEQVIEGVHYHFRPDFRKEVQTSQKQLEKTVYRDRPWSLDDPDQLFTHEEWIGPSQGLPRRQAKVLVVNRDYGFVVVDAGFENGFGKNVILDVIREGRRIGKVMITKPRDKISGAVILPEWRTAQDIRAGDIVGMSP